MKMLFLKYGMPVATAVLAIAGAFATTSMQNSSSAFALTVGYTVNAQGECDIPVTCSDLGTSFCRLSYPIGPQAFEKILGNCTSVTYRPQQ